MLAGNLRFHHLGLAVLDDSETLIYLSTLGYDIGEKLFDPEQNVHVRLCTSVRFPAIEIVVPGVGKTPLEPILNRGTEAIYHTCYEVENAQSLIESFEQRNLRVLCVSPPKPAILFEGRAVSFYRVVGFGVIELLESPPG